MSAFSEYATSIAFNINLSGPMIEALCGLDKQMNIWCGDHTVGALVHRGLIERIEGNCECIQLTEAGEAIVPLLRLADVYVHNPYLGVREVA